MRSGALRALALGAAASLLAVACGGSGATTAPTSAPSAAATTAAESPAASGLPYTGTLKDGSTFTLAPRIVDKLAKGEPINYVFSYGSTSIPLFSPQYSAAARK